MKQVYRCSRNTRKVLNQDSSAPRLMHEQSNRNFVGTCAQIKIHVIEERNI